MVPPGGGLPNFEYAMTALIVRYLQWLTVRSVPIVEYP